MACSTSVGLLNLGIGRAGLSGVISLLLFLTCIPSKGEDEEMEDDDNESCNKLLLQQGLRAGEVKRAGFERNGGVLERQVAKEDGRVTREEPSCTVVVVVFVEASSGLREREKDGEGVVSSSPSPPAA